MICAVYVSVHPRLSILNALSNFYERQYDPIAVAYFINPYQFVFLSLLGNG
jgi:hypothetical protein